ncbi:DUF2931 family protein [Shewanella benthica]|uniref:DUF2931 family protein n=1 Tax=Shewanella benthica TaxID=43661 RepID=UPI00187ACCDF|nr:DUF2931 family protein [Shewanella benthica]MBE7216090.1 DUF2931 family protein [Shewanella benthica]MCL1063783.1 DUF2931 family protein [Shewanella benthica]
MILVDRNRMIPYFFRIKKLKQVVMVLLSLFFFQACAGGEANIDLKDGSTWRIYATAPFYYDVYVEQVNTYNDNLGWATSHTRLNRSYDSRAERIKEAKFSHWTFDPFSLELYGNYVNSAQTISPKVNAPEQVFIAWLSLAEGKYYQLDYFLSPELRQTMLHNLLYKDKDGLGCGSILLFGFIPGGEANVWLGACGKYTFIERVKALMGPFDESYFGKGHQSRLYPGLIRRQKERAEADGVTLFPIPPERLEHMRNSNTAPGSPVLLTKKSPPKLTHCWAEKPYNLKVKLEIGSPQHQLSRRIWNNAYDFAVKVRYLDTGIHLAWQEAEDKGFNAQQRELWVLARLSAQGQVPATQIAKGLELNSVEVKQVQTWADDFCRADSKLSSSSQNETNLE